MAANILIYGNDIGDTARNDLARAQIMDQRSRDAAAQRQNTASRMQQNKQFGAQLEQQDRQFTMGYGQRGQELDENRRWREAMQEDALRSREAIARQENQARILSELRRAAEAGMLTDDEIESALPGLDPIAQDSMRAMARSLREGRQQEYDAILGETELFNALIAKRNKEFQEGTVKPNWMMFRGQAGADEQNAARKADYEAFVAQQMMQLDPEVRTRVRFNRQTGLVEPSIVPPGGMRSRSRDPMDVGRGTADFGGEMGAGAVAAPAPGVISQPQTATATAQPPPITAQDALSAQMAALGLEDTDWPQIQALIVGGMPEALAVDTVRRAKLQSASPDPLMQGRNYLNKNSGFGW